MAELTDFSVQTAYSGLCKLWMLMVKIIGDIFEIIGGCESPTKAHSALEHPFHAGVHLGLIDRLSPVCLFDAFANSGTKAIIFFD
jgi:hypothetical protein